MSDEGTLTIRFPFIGGPRLLVPDPGQCVRLRLHENSRRQGFRAISCPPTTEPGEVVIWVATEDESRSDRSASRREVGLPWPTDRMLISHALPWCIPQEPR